MNLQIENINIEELKTYENNAKLHPAQQIEQIKKSIEQFGMNDPIAVWKDNVIIEGHGRLIACRELGFTQVPIIRLDDLSDEQRKAYALIHNKLTMNTGFDVETLEAEINELDEFFDFKFYGFTENFDTYFEDEQPLAQEEHQDKAKDYLIINCPDFRLEELKDILEEEGYKYNV